MSPDRQLRSAISDIQRLRQDVDLLQGRRGNGRSVTQSDLAEISKITLQSKDTATLDAVRADIAAIYQALIRLSNIYGTAP